MLDRVLSADVEDREDRGAQDEVHHRPEQPVHLRERHGLVEVVAVHRRERADLRFLLRERLHHADAGEVLLGLRREIAELRLQLLEALVHAAADGPERVRRERREDERDERELRVHAEHRHEGEQEREECVRQHQDAEADHLPNRLEVVREARHEIADPLVLEIREMHRLKVREQVVAHPVFDAPRRVEDPPPPKAAESALDRRQHDHERGEAQHDVQTAALRQRVDDPADEQRCEHRHECGETDDGDAHSETELVLSEVVQEGGPRRGHWRLDFSRTRRPPNHTPKTTAAARTNTGATPHTSARGPTKTSGRKLKIDTRTLSTPKTRPRMSSRSCSWSSVIAGTVMNAYAMPKKSAVTLTMPRKNGSASPRTPPSRDV